MKKTLVIITGPHAVGKMTVGQELAELFSSYGADCHVVQLCADFEERLVQNNTAKSSIFHF